MVFKVNVYSSWKLQLVLFVLDSFYVGNMKLVRINISDFFLKVCIQFVKNDLYLRVILVEEQ